jgi:type I restriction enzyme S subunit
MKAYERYKKTDLPWLEEIPAHWDMMRNKVFLQERKDVVGERHLDYDLLSLTKKGIIIRDISTGKGKFPKDFGTYKIVLPGQIVFCLFDVEETPRTVGLSIYKGMITGAYNVFSISGINSQYLQYYYIALDNVKALQPLYTGLRKVINTSTLLQTKLPTPSRKEQDQIVRFLDCKVSELNRFIRAKQKEIFLLTELLNTRIKNVVLGGLHPDLPKKSSQIEWLNNIPSHWETKVLFEVATEQSISNKNVHNQNLLSLSYGKIINKDINTTDGLLPASFDTYQIVDDGNIILRLTDLQNDKRSLRVGISTQTGIITSAYTCLKTRANTLPHYLYLLLHSYDICKVFYGMGGGVRQSIGYGDIKRMLLPLPPTAEQQEIVDYCYSLRENIEKMITELKREIALITEYRTRMISDVVTGKVDVRDIAVPEIMTEDTADEPTEEDSDESAEKEVMEDVND